EEESASIGKSTGEANTVVECVDIESRIFELDSTYRDYKDLLDRALYPDGFEGRLAKLTGQITYAKGKITIIETQYERLTELETQVRKLAGQVERLSGQNAKMLAEVKRLSESAMTIDSLNAVVIKLRQGLRQRDDLIFALVDSLFMQYDKDIAAMSDQEKRGVTARLDRRNVFSAIKESIRDNLQFLETTSLTGTDITRLSDEQAAFEAKWNGLGKKLADIYVTTDSKRTAEIAQVDTMLDQWKSQLNGLFWRSLNDVFKRNEIPVAEFANAEGFHSNLLAYLNEEIRKANEDKDGQRYFRYEAFSDSVWTRIVEPQWIPAMLKNGNLTQEQVDELQDKVDDWESIVSPPLTMVYIIVGFVMLVVVLYLYRRYTRSKHGSVDASGEAKKV
ncbi:MAG TPA: hypothetical protein VGA55_03035, partial [Bacteroidota bacterium]